MDEFLQRRKQNLITLIESQFKFAESHGRERYAQCLRVMYDAAKHVDQEKDFDFLNDLFERAMGIDQNMRSKQH